ncbi:GTP cyclohydrolase FolE2 [Syntrophotalea acetylenica]|uniref:GTP cyclohydrolase FolE2 n=1 Tax=Syntrophotalea acetylenica TaxID=29542 RepID=UPI002A35C187|nr:GTP cyclohydrolase FolE2 [Syntrophotalea acetylenica]MDY0261348.1 GTP cyclohydrolase FolE2 [Syntrophotalea acetylenica]
MNRMRDMQMERDTRNVAIDKVGVKDIHYPIVVMDKNRDQQHTVARINMYVDLPHHFKGTHMSRFVEILNRYRGEITMRNMGEFLQAMKDRLNASCAHIEMDFPYFIEKQAPVSKALSLMEYRCCLRGTLAETKDFVLAVEVPLTALCPCSKEISARGAHNQRSSVRVEVRMNKFIWIEDLISWVEECGSAPVYALLKREDEKAVTEQAYDNPMFVEDIVRAVTLRLKATPEITWFRVECENFESIHNHSAYAMVEFPPRCEEG